MFHSLDDLPGSLQILTLAHQINPEMITRAGGGTLWEDLRFLLDMEVPQGPAGMGFGSGQTNGISALSVDDAVGAVEEALDWPRILRVNTLGAAAGISVLVFKEEEVTWL